MSRNSANLRVVNLYSSFFANLGPFDVEETEYLVSLMSYADEVEPPTSHSVPIHEHTSRTVSNKPLGDETIESHPMART